MSLAFCCSDTHRGCVLENEQKRKEMKNAVDCLDPVWVAEHVQHMVADSARVEETASSEEDEEAEPRKRKKQKKSKKSQE